MLQDSNTFEWRRELYRTATHIVRLNAEFRSQWRY
jgi:hypothetical protein